MEHNLSGVVCVFADEPRRTFKDLKIETFIIKCRK